MCLSMFCVSFAISNGSDTENDYIEDRPNDPVYRVSGAGRFVGINIGVRVGTTNSIAYTRTFYGIGVLVHGSQDFAQNTDLTAYGQPGDDLLIGVVPTVTVSDPSIRPLPVQQRACYFDDELKLRTTLLYTNKLCIAECVLNTIYEYCKCLPFFYAEVRKCPANEGLFNYCQLCDWTCCVDLRSFAGPRSQCVLSDSTCLRRHRSLFASLQPDNGYNVTSGVRCNHCLPSCSTETFTTHTVKSLRKRTNQPPSWLLYVGINRVTY